MLHYSEMKHGSVSLPVIHNFFLIIGNPWNLTDTAKQLIPEQCLSPCQGTGRELSAPKSIPNLHDAKITLGS